MNFRLCIGWGIRNPFYKEKARDEPDEYAVKFSMLALGARFSYHGEYSVWVKIGENTIAKWVEENKDTCWTGQSVCCFDEDGDTDRLVYIV